MRSFKAIASPILPDRPHLRQLILALLLALLACTTFAPSLLNEFVHWDDPTNFLKNPIFWGVSRDHIKAMLTANVLGVYQPVSWLIFAVIYSIFELNPLGYHLAGIVFHAANTVLVFFLIGKFIAQTSLQGVGPASPPDQGDDVLPPTSAIPLDSAAWLAAAFWGLHPLRVEPVAWASAVPYTIATFFALLSLLAYIRYSQAKSKNARVTLYGLSILTFILSICSKSIAVPLPLVLLLIDLYPLNRWQVDKCRGRVGHNLKLIAEKVPYLLVSTAGALASLLLNMPGGGEGGLTLDKIIQRMGQAAYSPIFHLRLTAIPHPLLPFYYLPSYRFATILIPAVLLVLAITVILIIVYRRYPFLLIAWIAYLLLLAPHSGVIYHGSYYGADRYTYLTTIPFFMIIGAFWAYISQKPIFKKPGYISFLIIVTLLFTLTILAKGQCNIWQGTKSLWNHTLKHNATHTLALNNLGVAHLQSGETNAAMSYWQKAILISPEFQLAQTNIGIAYTKMGLKSLALRHLKKALTKNTVSVSAYNNIGLLYEKLGEFQKAKEAYDKALKIAPKSVSTINHLGNLYASQGKQKKALLLYKKAASYNPTVYKTFYNIAQTYRELGEIQKAISYYKKSIKLNPNYLDAYTNLSGCYLLTKNWQEAAQAAKKAVRIQPYYSDALFNLGIAQARLGQTDSALLNLKKSFATGERSLTATQIAIIYEQKGNTKMAERYRQKAEEIRKNREEIKKKSSYQKK
jgi:tetratricopeptide (TPR) repeat protein